MYQTHPGSTSIGRNVEKIRKMRGIKQDTLAKELGITHQAISKIEQSDFIEDDRLEQIAKVLGVTTEAIKNFSEEAIVFQIENMHDNAQAIYHYNNNINPLDKIVTLYEALLKSEREKVAMLEQLLKDKK